jgi:hypothetical protein
VHRLALFLRQILFKIIWSDEKKWNLDGPDGFRYYWHDLRKEPRYFSKRNFGGGSLMIWGGFNASGKLILAFVPGRMNSEVYQNVLDACLVPWLEDNDDGTLIFMHDNAPIHRSRSTTAWLADRNIPTFQHPARSPELNPIENIWGILVRRVYAENRVYATTGQLRAAIQAAWDNLEQEVIDNLVESMKNRIFSLIQRNGGPIHY